MTNVRIIHQLVRGGVSIQTPILKAKNKNESDKDFFERIAQQRIASPDDPVTGKYQVVDLSIIPTDDRYFRDAWVIDGKKISIDMNKAREIHLNKIRDRRASKFNELGFPNKLDSELEIAVISKSTRDKLQALREIPQKVDLSKASNPTELKAIWPDILNKE